MTGVQTCALPICVFGVHQVGSRLYFEVPTAELGKDFVITTVLAATPNSIGINGTLGPDLLVRWERRDNRILLRNVNYNNIATDTSLSTPKAMNLIQFYPIIAAFNVEAYGKDSAAVIEVTRLFTGGVPEFTANGRRATVDATRSFIDRWAAFSKNINVTIEKVPQGTRMIVKNDGAPMTKEILVNKLLSLGGSGKNFQGSVGGFGKAKEILYYAHKRYKIASGNHIVTGSGAGYDLAEQPHVNGTTSEVIIDGDWVSSLQTNVQSFAATAQWDGTLTCNGQELATNLRKGSPRRELDFGTVYTNKSFNKKLVVRIGGIPMFITYVDYPDCVLVELNGSSADVLASNRDVLRYPFCNQLDEFISEIAMNKRTAMKQIGRAHV